MSSRATSRIRSHPSAVAAAALVVLWLGIGTAIAVWFSGRIQDWSVMTDELLYAKLATSIADTGSPLPRVHGSSIAVYNQLYPLLLAPLYGALSPPEAFRAAHVLNAFLMVSAVFPAYLLGRRVLSRPWALAAAGLSVLVPWMVLTGFLMTESAAYPAFLWAVLGLHLAIAAPSPGRDLLAVAALGLAGLARTQFAVLVVVLPLVILTHEIVMRRSLLGGARQALASHRVLASFYAAGLAVAAVVSVAGSFGSLLGVYAVTVEEGSLLPSGVWSSAGRHLDAVAIGCGLVPLILGGGWMLATLVRPRVRNAHALATLSVVTIAFLTFEAASFSVRFGESVVRDRYLFYVVPLLLIGVGSSTRGCAQAAGCRRSRIGDDRLRRHRRTASVHDVSGRLGRLAGERSERGAQRAVRAARNRDLRRIARTVCSVSHWFSGCCSLHACRSRSSPSSCSWRSRS